jgi:hypothetical protein
MTFIYSQLPSSRWAYYRPMTIGHRKALGLYPRRLTMDPSHHGPQQSQHLGLQPAAKRAGQMGHLKDDQRDYGPKEIGLFSRLFVIPEPNSAKNMKHLDSMYSNLFKFLFSTF